MIKRRIGQRMQRKEEIESLLKMCEFAKESVGAFLRSINDYIAVVEGLPAVAKPLVRRDLEANTGMSADDWRAFLEPLAHRYSTTYGEPYPMTCALANGSYAAVLSAATLSEFSA